jgi:hypothetical protein
MLLWILKDFIYTGNQRTSSYAKLLPELVDDITIKLNKIVYIIIADGSYYSNNDFQILSFKVINPAINVKEFPDVERPITREPRI